MKILLDYLFPISVIEPTPAASTAFLKQVGLVCKPKGGVEAGSVTLCTSMTAVAALTANTEAQQLFNAGMSRVYIVLAEDLDLEAILAANPGLFYTLLVSSDFDKDDITLAKASGTVTITSYANMTSTSADTITVAGVAFVGQAGAVVEGEAKFQAASSDEATAASLAAQINAHATTSALVTATVDGDEVLIEAKEYGVDGNDIGVSYTDGSPTTVGATLAGLSDGKLSGGAGLLAGSFDGVIGVSEDDLGFLEDQAVISNRCAFYSDGNGAKNLCYAFGKMLSNSSAWRNQQYISMPFSDDVETLGDAENLFDLRISFVLSDDEYSNRLGFFGCGGKAIVAPYISKNLRIDMQSKALSYIAGNQPAYTKTQAALLEDELQKVIDGYIAAQSIEAGVIEVDLVESNFVADGEINISEPKALWRIQAEMRQTL